MSAPKDVTAAEIRQAIAREGLGLIRPVEPDESWKVLAATEQCIGALKHPSPDSRIWVASYILRLVKGEVTT